MMFSCGCDLDLHAYLTQLWGASDGALQCSRAGVMQRNRSAPLWLVTQSRHQVVQPFSSSYHASATRNLSAHTTYRDARWSSPYTCTIHALSPWQTLGEVHNTHTQYMPWQTKLIKNMHSRTVSLQCPGVMSGFGYMEMAYGPIQQPKPSGMI